MATMTVWCGHDEGRPPVPLGGRSRPVRRVQDVPVYKDDEVRADVGPIADEGVGAGPSRAESHLACHDGKGQEEDPPRPLQPRREALQEAAAILCPEPVEERKGHERERQRVQHEQR